MSGDEEEFSLAVEVVRLEIENAELRATGSVARGVLLDARIEELESELQDALDAEQRARDVLRECRRQLRAREKELGWGPVALTNVNRDV